MSPSLANIIVHRVFSTKGHRIVMTQSGGRKETRGDGRSARVQPRHLTQIGVGTACPHSSAG
jgi:hypothetical protein